MQKKNKKAKRITKLAQLRVRTGIKSGCMSYTECEEVCESKGYHLDPNWPGCPACGCTCLK